MCRSLGVIINAPVDLEFSLLKADKPFRDFGYANPDGWGMGWYKNNFAQIFRQGISAKNRESQLPNLSKKVISKIIIVHVRKGTGAISSEVNTHPFMYKNWLFAHNGSVNREYLLSLLKEDYKNRLEGETDSEVYFYWILQCIEEGHDIIDGLREAINKTIKKNHSGLNFLLSNGKYLYAFRYSSCSKNYYTLYKLKREPSEPGPIELLSKETEALLHSKSLKGERAVLVCSEKLTTEKWEDITFGSLLIIDPNLDTKEVMIL